MKSKETKMFISLFSPVVTLGCWLSSPSFTSPSRRTSGSDFPWTARKEAALYLKKFAEMMQIDGPRSSRTVDQMRAWAHDSVKGEGGEMDRGLPGRKGRKALENSIVEGKDLRGSDQVLHRQGQSPCKESSQACHPQPSCSRTSLDSSLTLVHHTAKSFPLTLCVSQGHPLKAVLTPVWCRPHRVIRGWPPASCPLSHGSFCTRGLFLKHTSDYIPRPHPN